MTRLQRIEELPFLALPEKENGHFQLYTQWTMPKKCEATLVFAVQGYADIFLNGHRIEATQPDDLDGECSVTETRVTLLPGINRLLFGVHTPNVPTFSHAQSHYGVTAGVLVKGKWVAGHLAGQWRWRKDGSFLPHQERVTGQLGFAWRVDLRAAACGDKDWEKFTRLREAQALRGKLRMRSLPPLQILPAIEPRVVNCALLTREAAEDMTVAQNCFTDAMRPLVLESLIAGLKIPTEAVYLSEGHPIQLQGKKLQKNQGVSLTLDLGGETVGYLSFEMTSPKDGVILDIAHGEHLDDGRVRARINTRNFADRFILKKGSNEFSSRKRRFGARYLELHLFGDGAERVKISRCTLLPAIASSMSEEKTAAFSCSDGRMNQLREVSLQTLRCCAHDHFEDCPWREQALYAYDSRNQALFGYYAWGNYPFVRESLRLLGNNRLSEGLLGLTAPGRFQRSIPVFSLAWILMMADYYRYSGDHTLADELKGQAEGILNLRLKTFDARKELLRLPEGEANWNFFEWVNGLDGTDDSRGKYLILESLYFVLAVEAYEFLYGSKASYHKLSEKLKKSVVKQSQGKDGLFQSWMDRKVRENEKWHWHTQAVALCLGLMKNPAVLWDRKNQKNREKLIPMTFSPLPYFLQGLLQSGAEGRKLMEQYLHSTYLPMLAKGATSLWETPLGAREFGDAGSLCHGWSAAAVWYCHRVVLGVSPLEPGFKSFEVRPYPGTLWEASGEIPTPAGKIHVSWRRNLKGELALRVEYPAGLKCQVASYPEFPIGQVKRIVQKQNGRG